MTYKRSKTDSSNYCPYCGRNFSMNRDRYYAMYLAHKSGGKWAYATTTCKACKHDFLFLNITPETVKKYGVKPVLRLEERGILNG